MRRTYRLVLAAALALAACTAAPEGNLTGSGVGGPFALVDGNGRRVTDADFKGKWRLIYFGYTFCPDLCPTDLQHIAQGVRAFEASASARAATVVPIFITVDPERDTPAAVKAFTAAFGPRIVGLTGSRAQIDPVLKEYRIFATRQGSGPDYMMSHSAMAYLMDPDGKPVSFLAQPSAAEVAAELGKYVS